MSNKGDSDKKPFHDKKAPNKPERVPARERKHQDDAPKPTVAPRDPHTEPRDPPPKKEKGE